MPLFSIIITSHNQAGFIKDAVNSALAQNYAEKEIIVVDDASTDESPRILEHYGDAIQLLKLESNVGASRARNTGVAVATGEYLVFLDGDDALLPWALRVYAAVVERQRPRVILAAMRWFEKQVPGLDGEQPPTTIEMVAYERLLQKDRPYRASASALIVARDVFSQVQGWSNEIFPMEDLDVLLKLLDCGRTAHILSPRTVHYRIHAANTIHQVANCAGVLQTIMKKQKSIGYPGGGLNRAQRYAFLGGPVLFWFKKACKSGLYLEAWRLLAHGWFMILAAGARHLTVTMRGRRETMCLQFEKGGYKGVYS